MVESSYAKIATDPASVLVYLEDIFSQIEAAELESLLIPP
jgi:hypothetical protein